MARWLLLLGGPIVWFGHFIGVYGAASLADVAQRHAEHPAALWAVGALTLLCIAANGIIIVVARRRQQPGEDDLDRFIHRGAAWGGGFSMIAVAWQALPALFAG